jgi:tetratricopeptide (TPR) repeat protein
MKDQLKDLQELDPSDSMSVTLAAIVSALDHIEGSKDANLRSKMLKLIGEKEKEAFEYYLRPLDDDAVYNRLVALHQAQGNVKAVERCRRALDIRQARKWTVLGDSQAVVGNNTKAVHYLKRAMFFGPMEDVAGEVQSALERSEKRVEKANREVDRTLEKLKEKHDSEKLLLEAGKYLLDLDRIDEALKMNKKLISVSSDEIEPLYQKGCILFSRGDYKKALSIFEGLRERKPDSLNIKRCLNWTLQMMEGS